jgi:hypothetical protein
VKSGLCFDGLISGASNSGGFTAHPTWGVWFVDGLIGGASNSGEFTAHPTLGGGLMG